LPITTSIEIDGPSSGRQAIDGNHLSRVFEIGAGAIVGAGSVVTRAVPAGTIVAGYPAKLLRPIERQA